jgi:hypothetical protein
MRHAPVANGPRVGVSSCSSLACSDADSTSGAFMLHEFADWSAAWKAIALSAELRRVTAELPPLANGTYATGGSQGR